MNLNNCVINKIYLVERINGGSMATRRLTHLGITPNTPLKVIRKGIGPILIEVRGTRLALGRGIASKVIVKNEGI